MKTPQDVVERLCKLQQEVVDALVGSDQPNDCFCGRGGWWKSGQWPNAPTHFRTAEQGIDFIEAATRKALAEELALRSAQL